MSVGEHKYSDRYKRGSCKFYKGDGYTKGFVEGYMPFHKDAYQRQKALNDNPYVLQILEQTDFISSLQSLGKNPNTPQTHAHAET